MRRNVFRLAWLLVLTGSELLALPRIHPKGIVNAASFARPGLPGGGIARGSIFTIFGSDLGSEGGSPPLSFPLGDTLGGVAVSVTQGDVTVNAIPIFVGPGQVNAIMPSGVQLGRASVRVISRGRLSNPSSVEIVESSVGIFTAIGSGMGPGIVQNVNTSTDRPINSPRVAAAPGQLVTVWATGLGPADFPDNEAPEGKTLPTEVEIFVGGVQVPQLDINYSGRSPCCAGVDQIVFRLPADSPRGCYVPVMIRTNRDIVSNGVTMAVGDTGGQCADPANPFGETPFRDGAFGTVVLIRAEVEMTVDVPQPFELRADFAVGSLRRETATDFPFERLTAMPPPGSCAAYAAKGSVWRGEGFPFLPQAEPSLDGGDELTVFGARGRRSVSRLANVANHFGGLLGGRYEVEGPFGIRVGVTPYLNEGGYSISAEGGADVGAFETDVTVGAPVVWSNRDEVDVVDRAQDLTLRWTGANGSGLVGILGGAFDGPTDSTAGFFCLAPANEEQFSVPAMVLSTIPASRAQAELSEAMVLLWNLPAASVSSFSAEGLDGGTALAFSLTGKTVIFE